MGWSRNWNFSYKHVFTLKVTELPPVKSLWQLLEGAVQSPPQIIFNFSVSNNVEMNISDRTFLHRFLIIFPEEHSTVCLKVQALGVPETFVGGLWGQNSFRNNTRRHFSLSLCWHSHSQRKSSGWRSSWCLGKKKSSHSKLHSWSFHVLTT